MSVKREPVRLGVNIDHVATVRQARRAVEPDPVTAAVLALLGGADGITVHLREDRRHIQDRDVRALKPIVTNRLNLEMAVSDEIISIACEVRPHEATLVPEKRMELTTEGGLDVIAHQERVGKAIQTLTNAGIEVAVFIDPDPRQVDCSKALGAKAVEFQTASYSEARNASDRRRELVALSESAAHAAQLGLGVHMGHGLNYTNIHSIIAIPSVQELNIGHSIISRAVLVGMERAVREMKELLQR